MKSTFIACIEKGPKAAFEIQWDGDSIPHDIEFPDGKVATLVGKYASPGERFCYRWIKPEKISHAELTIVQFNKLAGIS